MRLRALALVVALFPAAVLADAQSDAQAAARLTGALEGLSTLRAEFRQAVTDAQGHQTESAEGTVVLARPGRFRWDYRTPPQVIVSDGTTVWLYDIDLAQVTIRSAEETLVGTPAQLLSGQADVAAEFAIADGGEEDGLSWSRLTPKSKEGDFQELRVGIAGRDLRRMILIDRLGQTTRLDFEKIERNPRLEPGVFSFSPPAGVDVIGQAPPGGA
jgi:outer membrane lipoprotein carrier protein